MLALAAPLAPPQHFAINTTREAIFTYAQILPVGFCVAAAMRFLHRRRDPALLFCMLGALLACFVEPILDLTTNVWLGSPAQGQWAAFNTLGHPFPLWTLGSYTWYVGGEAFLVYHLLTRRGFDQARRQMWLCFSFFVITDMALEIPGLALHVYAYYGPQALKILRFPLFWTAANSAIPVILGSVLYLIRPRITGWRNIVIVPLVPIVSGGVWGAVLFPVANAQNAAHRLPMSVIDLCGLATITLSVLCVWLITQIMPRVGQSRSTLLDEAQRFHDALAEIQTTQPSAARPLIAPRAASRSQRSAADRAAIRI
jgi:hypothetical protein